MYATLSLSVSLNNMECQPVRCFCHFVSLAPEASRTQSKVCTQHEVSDTSEDPEKPSGLGSAASLVLCCSQARVGGACPPPARHFPPLKHRRSELICGSRRPPPNAPGPGMGTQSDGTGTFLQWGSSEPQGRRRRGGGRSSRSSPGRADGGPVQTPGTECAA